MYYEINLSKNGTHYFATNPRSLLDEAKAKEIYLDPVSEGFKLDIRYWRNEGHPVEWATTDTPNVQSGCVHRYPNEKREWQDRICLLCGETERTA